MTIKRWGVVALVLAVGAGWWLSGSSGGSDAQEDAHAKPAPRSVDTHGFTQQLQRTGRTGAIEWRSSTESADGVTISGQVIDLGSHTGVGNIEVVFRTSDGGEASTTTTADGAYRIVVAAGTYHAFVRDDVVLSVGATDLVRLPGLPDADAANVPDEGLMPTVVASTDVQHLDLSVMTGGKITGHVRDRAGHPIADAVVRARGADPHRPTLGTDVATSDETGAFEMRLPPGGYEIEATHAQLAGMTASVEVQLAGRQWVDKDITLTAGCVIAGRVVAANGQPAGDGAIERRYGDGDNQFAPAGKIGGDGTFRWVIAQPGDVTLRAWPWKSPPSQSQTFACSDGARFTSVVFQLPAKGPDIDGVLLDAQGQPVPLAYVDIAPLDDGFGQQERADAQGHWSVYNMVPGRYHITATAPGRGVVTQDIVSPVSNVRLQLSGTGRLEGTTGELADGSFEVSLETCDSVNLAHQPRLVAVHDHHYAIEDLPACALTLTASWHGDETPVAATIVAGGIAHADLELGPPRAITVHGVVMDTTKQRLAGVHVQAVRTNEEERSTITDAAGAFTIDTYVGAILLVGNNERMTTVEVDTTGQVEIELGDTDGNEPVID